MKKRVYLAGDITGHVYGNTTAWREYATAWLRQWDIEGLSPMRGKDYLANETSIRDSYEGGEYPLSMAKGFTGRDRDDVRTSDLIIANFASPERVSIGTVIECAWADAYRKLLIVVLPEHSPANHAMLKEIAQFVVPTLDQALALVPPILNARRVIPDTADVQLTLAGK